MFQKIVAFKIILYKKLHGPKVCVLFIELCVLVSWGENNFTSIQRSKAESNNLSVASISNPKMVSSTDKLKFDVLCILCAAN